MILGDWSSDVCSSDLVPNLFQEHTGMLQLLLEVDGVMGNSHPFVHHRDDLRGLLFQDRTCGAPLGYVSVSRRELTFFFTPVHFLNRLLCFDYHGTCHCPNGPGSLPPTASCPVAAFRPTASLRFIVPRWVTFSGSSRVRQCGPGGYSHSLSAATVEHPFCPFWSCMHCPQVNPSRPEHTLSPLRHDWHFTNGNTRLPCA